MAWPNVEDVVDEESSEVIADRDFADGFVAWASLSLGMDI